MTTTHNTSPQVFTQEQLDWQPWIAPLQESELSERHYAGLVDAARAHSTYFRLLARDPDTLGARTRTDKDIFYNPDAGLPRAERELSATATLIFTPSSAAFATAASRATLTASAETTDWGTATVETGFWLMLGSRKSYIRL